MSRHLAAYFAIVGTLAFASSSAASAGQLNIPQVNIPRPQFRVPTPHLSVSPPRNSVPTQTLSSARMISVGKGMTPHPPLSYSSPDQGLPDPTGPRPPVVTNSASPLAIPTTNVGGQGGGGSYGGG